MKVSVEPRSDPPPAPATAAPAALTAEDATRAHGLEAALEQALDHGIERAEQSLASSFGTHTASGLRTAVKVAGWGLVVAYFGVASLLLVTRYAVLPTIDQWRPHIEASASSAIGLPLTIGRIDASWRGLRPHFALNDVKIADQSGTTVVELPRVEATVAWSSVLKWQPQFTRLRVMAPAVDVALLSGDRIAIAGFILDPRAPSEEDGERGADWLLAQGEVTITDAIVQLRDQRDDAGREMLLDGVNFTLVRGWGSHRFGMTASPPSSLAAPIDVRGRFRYPPLERASDFTQWSGEVFAQLDFVDLAQVNQWVQIEVEIDRAHGALRAWVRFDETELTGVTTDVALKDFEVRLATDLQPLRLTSLQGRLSQQSWGNAGHGGQALAASRLTFAMVGGQVFPPLDLTLRTTRAESGRAERTEVLASRIDLASLAAVATHVPVARDMRELISRHAVRGELSDVSLNWDGARPDYETLSLKMRFTGLVSAAQFGGSTDSSGAVQPGFENLSGSIDLEQGAGRLQLAARDAVLVFPGVFEQPRLALAQLNGNVTWKNAPQLEVHVDSLAASNPDFDLSASGDWKRAEAGPGAIDLNARITRLNAATAFRYVPQGVGPATLNWLQHGLVAGRLSDGVLRLRGNLDRFPFAQPADGEFRFTGRVRDATLDVAPAPAGAAARRPGSPWPLLTGIDADLLFERAGMTITAERGKAQGATIDRATARIPTLGKSPTLEVRGQVSGTLASMLGYVNASPVAGWIGGITEGASGSGNAKLDLSFDLPLAAPERTSVTGALQLNGNDLNLPGVPPLARVTGSLGFTEKGPRFTQLAAGLLGGTARFDTQARTDGLIVMTAVGTTTPTGLKSLADNAVFHRVLDRAQGSARYSSTLSMGNGSSTLQVDSDLVGLGIDGVAPLRKASADSLPLRFERTWTSQSEDLQVAAGKAFAMRLEQRRENNAWRLVRGAVALNEAATLPAAGMRVNVNVPRFDVEAWENWLGEPASGASAPSRGSAATTAATPPELPFDQLTLRTAELVVMRRSFRNVAIDATRAQGGLDATVASDNLAGRVTWRPGTAGVDAGGLGRINARLSKLVIPSTEKNTVVDALKSPAQQLPSLDLIADSVEIGSARLGRVEMTAQNSGAGATSIWRVRRFEVTNPDMHLSATGEWIPLTAGARRMSMKMRLDLTDAGATLLRLGRGNAIARGQGVLQGELDWVGVPFDVDFASLSGKLNLKLDNGRFTKIETGNAARLLGLLSLQSLSRSLGAEAGNFAEGFAFTSILADATIERGVMNMPDLRMAGHNAAVVMSGNINLSAETQQLHLVVLPEVDASTAALAMTVVNPVLGLGTWLAQTVLRDPLSRALAMEFDVTGTWADPVVARRSRFAANSPDPIR